MKILTKAQERKLNRLPHYEHRYKQAYDESKERIERLQKKADAMWALVKDVKVDDPEGVPPNYLEVMGLHSVFVELTHQAVVLQEVELRSIELEASNNSNEVVLDILSRFTQEELMKSRLPQKVEAMRKELFVVKHDLDKEKRVAQKAKRWLLRAEKYRPKTGRDSLGEMFP